MRIQGLSDVSGTAPVLHRLCRWRFALLVPLSSGFLERRGKRLPSARTGCCLLLPLFVRFTVVLAPLIRLRGSDGVLLG